MGKSQLAVELFWHLDIVGNILLIAMLACILVPFTLAGGVTQQWKTAKVIAPLVIGVLLIPVWIFWERTCKHPMLPFNVSQIIEAIFMIFADSFGSSFSKTVLSGVPLESLSCSTPVRLSEYHPRSGANISFSVVSAR
jgi:hypothetical protein